MQTLELLDRLIAFPTVSRDSNLDLIHFVQEYLNSHGVSSRLIYDEEGNKANLHAIIGPEDVPGIILSGHTDVVPVDGQDWSSDPFVMREEDGRHYGRGAADMKGFVASVLAAVPTMTARTLTRPIHLAFSHDEEIGCVGVRSMIDDLVNAPVKPALCIVGEPTLMKAAIGHKGKTDLVCTCHGVESHSALAPNGLNSIYLASEMISAIRDMQTYVIETGAHDDHYAVPYTSLHVGVIDGGTALNIVPNTCKFRFEIRNLLEDDPMAILAKLEAKATEIASAYQDRFPSAKIDITISNEYPGLNTAPDAEVVTFVKSLTGANDHNKVAFGTEGGLFQERLGVPTVICGPGSMDQGHKPDEFITGKQLGLCDDFLSRLLDRVAA